MKNISFIYDYLIIMTSLILGIIAFNKCLKLETKTLKLENEILQIQIKYEILNKKVEYLNRTHGIHDFPLEFKNKKQNK